MARAKKKLSFRLNFHLNFQAGFLGKLANRLSHSYSFLVLVVSMLGLLALDWASHYQKAKPPEAILPPLAALGTTQSATTASAAAWDYFHPLWTSSDPWARFFADHSAASLPMANDDLSAYVSDPLNRLHPEFKVSTSLRSRVLFWVEVYARYPNRIKVVHDRNNPNVIYGYIDFRPLYRAMGKSPLADAKALVFEQQILKKFRTILAEAIAVQRPSSKVSLSATERQAIRDFLSRVGALSEQATAQLIANVRSQTGQRDEFLQALHRASTLLPHIETVFKKQGLPVELARIPFVESSFNVNARSSVGAVGIWQFMPETARQMFRSTEEKLWSDPILQTVQAAKLIRIFKNVLGDWSLTVTSYNSGVGRLKALSTKHKAKNLDALLNLPHDVNGLGFAGENFYAEFLAANIVEAYKEEIFKKMLGGVDLSIVFRGGAPFPKNVCDL